MKEILAYLKNPFKALTFTVIGAGGTGSQFLARLAVIAVAYAKLRRIKIHVIVWDGDEVSESNVGRQLFSHGEIGMNKAVCMVNKINRTYGLHWQAMPIMFGPKNDDKYHVLSNFLVSCVDNVSARKVIHNYLNKYRPLTYNHTVMDDTVYGRNFFWFDIGNDRDNGQVVIGSQITPDIIERYPDLRENTTNTPSCSLAEALSKQDLFINTFAAMYAAKLVWEILTTYKFNWAGVYFNLVTLKAKRIPIDAKETNYLRGIVKSRVRKSAAGRIKNAAQNVQQIA